MAANLVGRAQPAQITIAANQPGHKISPTLWGVFFEDINMSADGGIYPELVRNRSFEDGEKPEFWKFTNSPGAQGECLDDVAATTEPAVD